MIPYDSAVFGWLMDRASKYPFGVVTRGGYIRPDKVSHNAYGHFCCQPMTLGWFRVQIWAFTTQGHARDFERDNAEIVLRCGDGR